MFSLPKVKWQIVVTVAILSFLFLFSSQYLYTAHALSKIEDSLSGISGLKDAKVFSDDQLISLEMMRDGKLSAVMTAVEENLAESVNLEEYKIEIKDNSNEKLNRVFQDIHYFVYEGIATGRFGEMHKAIRELESTKDVELSIEVSLDRVFVQIRDGDHILYRVIEV